MLAHIRRTGLLDLLQRINGWPHKPLPPYDELQALEKEMDAIVKKVEDWERTRSSDAAAFNNAGVLFDWNLLKKIRLNTVRFGHRYCAIAASAYDFHEQNAEVKGGPLPGRVRKCLEDALQFAFKKVYQFAGGFDDKGATKELFSRINKILMTAPATPEKPKATPSRKKRAQTMTPVQPMPPGGPPKK